jgi:hypothetical protein
MQIRQEVPAAPLAPPHPRRHSVLSPAVSVQGCCAVWAEDAQVAEAIIRWHAVRVIQDQRHASTTPKLTLPAHLALPLLHPLREETQFQAMAAMRGVLHQDLCQRLSRAADGSLSANSIRVEVICWNSPQRRIPFKGPWITSTRAVPQSPQGICPTTRPSYRGARGPFSESWAWTSHDEHMFACGPDVLSDWGARIRTEDLRAPKARVLPIRPLPKRRDDATSRPNRRA